MKFITVIIDVELPTKGDLNKLINSSAVLANDIFKCIFVKENDDIPTEISLKFVPRGPIHSKSALVQVMAWRRTDDKPLHEPKTTQFTDAYMRH